MKQYFILPAGRSSCLDAVKGAQGELSVTISELTRTGEQNAAQWPILDAFSKQLEWPVNGRMVKMAAEEWKDILTAAFRQEVTRLAMGLNGGVVMLGSRTSKFGKKEFSDWLEFLNATAVDRKIKITYQGKL